MRKASKFFISVVFGFFFLVSLSIASPKPNIVYIIADDHAYNDFGFMGSDHVETPNLDYLASKSLLYVNGYVPSSVCRPSLATLLTGTYPHQNGIYFNHSPPGFRAFGELKGKEEYDRERGRAFEIIRKTETLPRILRNAGYRTLQTGKFWEGHFSNAGFTHGMTIYEPVPGLSFSNRTLANGDVVVQGNGDWGLKIGRFSMEPIFNFIDESEAQPFFIWYAPFLPHLPHDAPDEFLALYSEREDIEQQDIRYFASISWFDDTVGQLVDYIESNGLADNTLFVFVSDNGWSSSDRKYTSSDDYMQSKRSKRSPFEQGVRTPILFRYDRKIEPGIRHELVSSIDIMPSVLRRLMSAGELPELPGLDIIESAPDSARPVYGEIYPGDASSFGKPEDDIAYRWVRKGDYKLIFPHSHDGQVPWMGFLKKPALYNVVFDEYEANDLMGSPEYRLISDDLLMLLDNWWHPKASGR